MGARRVWRVLALTALVALTGCDGSDPPKTAAPTTRTTASLAEAVAEGDELCRLVTTEDATRLLGSDSVTRMTIPDRAAEAGPTQLARSCIYFDVPARIETRAVIGRTRRNVVALFRSITLGGKVEVFRIGEDDAAWQPPSSLTFVHEAALYTVNVNGVANPRAIAESFARLIIERA